MTTALQKSDTAIGDVVALLAEGRKPKDERAILRAAITAMSERVNGLQLMMRLTAQLNGFLVMMSSAIADTVPGEPLRPRARKLFDEAAQLGKTIVDPRHNNDALWRGLIQSLRAECLLLVGDAGAAGAAAMTATSLLKHLGANHFVDQRATYVARVLDYLHGEGDKTPPPITTREFLEELQESLPQV